MFTAIHPPFRFDMTFKKLIAFNNSRYAVPVVEAAHRLGVHVITAHYLPDNEVHQVSDGYGNVCDVKKCTVLNMERS